MEQNKLIKLQDVLSRVGFGRSAWYALIAEGRAPAGVKLGKRLRLWPESTIDEFVNHVAKTGEFPPASK